MRADPPYSGLNFIPLYIDGLWLAVMTTPPPAFRFFTVKDTMGVGVGFEAKRTGMSLLAATSARLLANISDRNRVSYPTIKPLWSKPLVFR